MRALRIASIGSAAAVAACVIASFAFVSPAQAYWHHGWHGGWHPHGWYRPWVPPAVVVAPGPYYYAPPAYYAPPPPVVYAPPAYYAPGVSFGVTIR